MCKIIFKVLNYARKTKYPERRSAFTYIDEEEPSRLDYGKHKFGGPFTEEEVEDVAILRTATIVLECCLEHIVANDTREQFPGSYYRTDELCIVSNCKN